MARVTIEDCLEHVSDHFALVHLAAKRFRQLQQNPDPSRPVPTLVPSDNKFAVTALREIAAGKVFFRDDVNEHMHHFVEQSKLQQNRAQDDFDGGE